MVEDGALVTGQAHSLLADDEARKNKRPADVLGVSDMDPQQQKKKKSVARTFDGKTCEVTITEGGKSLSFQLSQGTDSVLDAALRNSADLPYACKGGVCASCRAKLLKGEVEMETNYALEQEELDAGYILTCQAIPVSDKVIVDFDV